MGQTALNAEPLATPLQMLGNVQFDPSSPPKVKCPFCRRVTTVEREEVRKGTELWRNLCCILSAPFCFCSLVYCWDYVDFFCADCHSKVACQESERTGSGLVVYGPGGQTQRYHSSTTA
ncbi:hypothetical protein QC762_404360 [Podospora pseudocomata]|uniref:LITAF domain-containing protein n=1 Tax=Podospora pseudocomata TaxID=2093779 RepID=A0ABR0GH97_9PEZI|nr:hypothetical protein QC762_404360 [Podospora pseudocomata]